MGVSWAFSTLSDWCRTQIIVAAYTKLCCQSSMIDELALRARGAFLLSVERGHRPGSETACMRERTTSHSLGI